MENTFSAACPFFASIYSLRYTSDRNACYNDKKCTCLHNWQKQELLSLSVCMPRPSMEFPSRYKCYERGLFREHHSFPRYRDTVQGRGGRVSPEPSFCNIRSSKDRRTNHTPDQFVSRTVSTRNCSTPASICLQINHFERNPAALLMPHINIAASASHK